MPGQDVLASAVGPGALDDVEVVELARSSSTRLELADVFRWARDLGARLGGDSFVAGVVVVTGTETLEEVAYLFDLVVDDERPVVFTGAMRAPGEEPSDGPRNVRAALAVAAAPAARGLGTLVVLDDEIHAARDVVKTNGDALGAFASPGAGPLGVVRRTSGKDDELVLRRRPLVRERVATTRLEPRVEVVTAVLGADGRAIEDAVARGVAGLVVETFAAGGVTPGMAHAIEDALARNVVVVAASRAPGTLLTDVYAGIGEGRWLLDRGVLFADDLTAAKARIKLMLALGKAGRAFERYFERGGTR